MLNINEKNKHIWGKLFIDLEFMAKYVQKIIKNSIIK